MVVSKIFNYHQDNHLELKTQTWSPPGRNGRIVLDPDTVTDKATQSVGGLSSTGIPYAVVNGTIVWKDSKVLKGVHPGKSSHL